MFLATLSAPVVQDCLCIQQHDSESTTEDPSDKPPPANEVNIQTFDIDGFAAFTAVILALSMIGRNSFQAGEAAMKIHFVTKMGQFKNY